MSTNWYCENIMGSDHSDVTLEITFEIQIIRATKKTYIDFKKFDCKNFRT